MTIDPQLISTALLCLFVFGGICIVTGLLAACWRMPDEKCPLCKRSVYEHDLRCPRKQG